MALKKPEWVEEAQVELELELGVGFTTALTDCLQQMTRWWSCLRSRRYGRTLQWQRHPSPFSHCSSLFHYCYCCTERKRKDCIWQTLVFFFRDYNEDSPWGWNHWLKKTVFRARCWPQGETFEACKVQLDSLALHVLSNSWAFETKYVCFVAFFKRWRQFFFCLGRPIFLGLSPKPWTSLDDHLKRKHKGVEEELRMAKEQSRGTLS